MLTISRRKITYLFIAIMTGLMLLSTPIVVPSAHADCSTASSCNSVG